MCARVHATTDDSPVAPSIGNAIVLVHIGQLKRGPDVQPQHVTMAQSVGTADERADLALRLKRFLALDSILRRPLTDEEVVTIVLGAPICERFLVDGHCPRKTFCPESVADLAAADPSDCILDTVPKATCSA